MPRPRRRRSLEHGSVLDLNKLLRNGLRTGSVLIRAGDTGVVGKLSVDFTPSKPNWLRVQLPDLDQTFELRCQPRRFGGEQWYLICPMTAYRASVLYRPN